MHWPFNYPGDEYLTNIFSQVIILLEDIKDATTNIKDAAIDFIDNIKEEINNEKNS